jgi:hypothetical protein
MSNKKKIILAISLVAVAAILFWIFSSKEEVSQVEFVTSKVVRGEIGNSVTATGTIEPVTEVEVGTQVSGIIDRIYVDYNSVVKKGQLIAEMDKIMENTFCEEEDFIIQEKYSRELLDKYKLTVTEVNEGYALVNKESRKLISNDIMETTIYNIISEAVYGETDLTEKTRIYFFNK